MQELSELYQELVLDHSKNPRNFGKMVQPDRTAEGYNPLCGDKVQIYLKLAGEVIAEISFEGSGCAISKSSASLMCESVKGKTKTEAETLFENFHSMLTDSGEQNSAKGYEIPKLGKLMAFSGVREFPVRVKCATLAWHTLKSALESKAHLSLQEKEKKVNAERGQAFNPETLKQQVVEVLRTCYDPEIPVDIYELGLIYGVEIKTEGKDSAVQAKVEIQMTLTSPMCPVAESLPPEVERKVKTIPGVKEVIVDVVWDPPWEPSKMSEAAKLQLGM